MPSYSTQGSQVDVSNGYAYPNPNSYRGRLGTLAKGAIFAVDMVPNPLASGTAYSRSATSANKAKFFKTFQFNPPTIQMYSQFAAIDPAESAQGSGNLDGLVGMGQMSFAVELLFNREIEVFRSVNRTTGSRASAVANEVYKSIGVQKDIYDLYRVILAERSGDFGLPDDMTLSAITGRAFDLAATGSQLQSRMVGLYFNDYLIIYGTINGFNVAFTKFSNAYVPTVALVNLTLDVTNVRPFSPVATSSTAPDSRAGESARNNENPTAPPTVTPFTSAGADVPDSGISDFFPSVGIFS